MKAQNEIKPFIISRTFDAPRDRVWKAFTEAEQMQKWWGPKGGEVLSGKMDFRVGGSYHYGMKFAGQQMWGKAVYKEIIPQEKIVYINSFSNEKGGLERHPLAPTWPIQMLTVVTMTEYEGKTTFKVEWTPIDPTDEEKKIFDESHDKMRGGWGGTFDQLSGYLAGNENIKLPFVIERVYNAPAEKVWKAITDKDQMKQWYFDLPEFKPEVGCKFEFTAGKDDVQYRHLCEVTEVIPGKKITYSWRYDGYEGNSFVTWELISYGGKTRLKLTHAGLETFPKTNPDLDPKNFAAGWTGIIGDSLTQFLEK